MIKIGEHRFEGPFTSTDKLEDRSGIYAILSREGSTRYVLDIGESARIKTRVENHDRKACWNGNAKGVLEVAALYTPGLQQAGRSEVEQELRSKYSPTCGDR